MKRTIKDYLAIYFKGMAMGAADVVPGVSGGTIAFISGIYEELINSIKAININSAKSLFSEGIPAFWKNVNGNFLLAIFMGILTSVLTLAVGLKFLLETQPVLIWSFFFGLIVASAIYIARTIDNWNLSSIVSMLLGIVIAFFITATTPAQTPENYGFIFLSGTIAICAMILPGISGSFILVLLGKYAFILGALSGMKIDVIAVFSIGAVVGLLSFSNLLSWLLKNFKNNTIAVLAGFMIGSLNKVWPWKQTISCVNSHGDKVPLDQSNVLPAQYSELPSNELIASNEPQVLYAILLAIAGMAVILIFDRLAKKSTKHQKAEIS